MFGKLTIFYSENENNKNNREYFVKNAKTFTLGASEKFLSLSFTVYGIFRI